MGEERLIPPFVDPSSGIKRHSVDERSPALGKRPGSGIGPRGKQDRPVAQRDGAADNMNHGGKWKGRSREGLVTLPLGQDPDHAAGTGLHQPGVLLLVLADQGGTNDSEIRVRHGVVGSQEIDPAVEIDRGAALDPAVLHDPAARHGRDAPERGDDPVVPRRSDPSGSRRDHAIRVRHATRRHIHAAETRVGRVVRGQPYLKARCQDGLSVRRADRALIVDIRSDQRDEASRVVSVHRSSQRGSPLDLHIADRTTDHGGKSIGFLACISRNLQRREEELGIGVVGDAAPRLGHGTGKVLVDRQCRGDQGVDIHLGAVVEHDPVLVQDIDLSLGRDLAIDAGGGGISGDLVEGDPLACISPPRTLVEIDGRPRTDIEILPGEVGILGGLGDLDIVISGGLKTGLLQVDSGTPP